MGISMSFTIQATTAHEISRGIRELAAIMEASAKDAGITSDAPAPSSTPTSTIPAPTVRESSVPEQDLPASAPLTEPAPQGPADPAPSSAEPQAPTVSFEDVRAKLASLVQAGKQPQVKELLASFGATKLSEVPAERYGELMAKAGEIG